MMKFPIGSKVIPISKKAGLRDFKTSTTFYRNVELGQNFLFVVEQGEEKSKNGEDTYWCNNTFHKGGDLYAESDLILK